MSEEYIERLKREANRHKKWMEWNSLPLEVKILDLVERWECAAKYHPCKEKRIIYHVCAVDLKQLLTGRCEPGP